MTALPLAYHCEPFEANDPIDIADLTSSLRSLMVRNMGIVRDKRKMKEALRDVEFWCRYGLRLEFEDRKGWELQNLLTVARLMISAALGRAESRGTHFRSDFPERDDAQWLRHIDSERIVV